MPRLTARRLAAGLMILVGFLYYRPITAYVETRDELDRRAAEVQKLHRERVALTRRVASTSSEPALAAEARRLQLLRPGERLFIIDGIAQWRRAHARRRAR